MSSPSLKSILLIDDDEISNLFNKIFINKLKLDVAIDFVPNGKEAMELLSSREKEDTGLFPCLLLLDIKMPVMDGWQFLDAYEATISDSIKEKITIIMLTTSADEGDMIKAMKYCNVKDYIQKPLSDSIFRKLIKKYFEN